MFTKRKDSNGPKKTVSDASMKTQSSKQPMSSPPIQQDAESQRVQNPPPTTPPAQTFQRDSPNRRGSDGYFAPFSSPEQVLQRPSTSPVSPIAQPRSSPGRLTWTKDGRRLRKQQGPLASTPELATVHSQYFLGDEPETPLTPPTQAHLKGSGKLMEPFESSPPTSGSPASSGSGSGSGFFEFVQTSRPEYRRVYSSAPVPHEYMFPRYGEVLRVKGLKPLTVSDISPTPSRPTSSSFSANPTSSRKAMDLIEDIPSPPRNYATKVNEIDSSPLEEYHHEAVSYSPASPSPHPQQYTSHGLTEVRRPLMKRGPPSPASMKKALELKLSNGKDYLRIARENRRLCELFRETAIESNNTVRSPTIESLLKNEPAFLEAFQSPYESCGLVINCNDRGYIGQPYTKMLSILRKIWDGMVDFGAAQFDNSLRYHVITYIVARHASRAGDGSWFVESLADLLRSLCVQLLAKFGDELFLDNEYLNNVNVNDSYSLLWAFMTLLSAVATRRRTVPSAEFAISGISNFPEFDTRPKTRLLIVIDGVHFLEEGTDKPCREYEEFFHEMDELVIKLREGHNMECFDALREEWEAKGLKEKGKYPREWQQFVKECEIETRVLRENLTLKYVFIHPQISKWKPRKFGGSVILPVENPIWI